jgi:hypothetical protein
VHDWWLWCDCERPQDDFTALRTEYQEHLGRVYDDYRIGIEKTIKTDPRSFFWVLWSQEKVSRLPIGWHKDRLASGSQVVRDLFAEFIERAYVDDSWVQVESRAGSCEWRAAFWFASAILYIDLSLNVHLSILRFHCFSLLFQRLRSRCSSWIVARVRASMVFHHWFWRIVLSDMYSLFQCSSTGHCQRVFSPMDEDSRLLLPWQWHFELPCSTANCSNCWCRGSCTMIWRAVL